MSDEETHWKEWKASGGLRGRSQMSDKPWNAEVERIRKAMMERFSDKLSMEEIAEFAYSVAEECTAPAPQTPFWVRRTVGCPNCGAEIAKAFCVEKSDLPLAAATPQVTPELELEQEADGRWLAAYTRFPGVAAYGHSKEEAIRNAAKVLIESEQASHGKKESK